MTPGSPISYADLTTALVERVPALFSGYAELRAMWDGEEPGPHVVFEDLLVPYASELLRRNTDTGELQPIFDLLEELAASPDQDVRDVLAASVLEGLGQAPDIRSSAKSYMGRRTKLLMEKIEQAWGA